MAGQIEPQRFGGDIGCRRCRCRNAVVATVGTAQRNTRQRYRLASADVPVAKGRAAIADADRVTTDHANERTRVRNRRRRAAVVGFVARRESSQGDAQSIDGAGGVAGIAHRIVAAAVAVIHRHAGNGDHLIARAGRLAGKGKCPTSERIAGKQCASRHRRCAAGRRAAVVGFGHVAGR